MRDLRETGTSGPKRTPRELAVDHNHETGQVRDLLCHNCNALLGMCREDKAVLLAAIKYLWKWNG
jgi:hypothetical protein